MFFKRFFIFCVCVLLNQVWAQTDNSVVETPGGRVTVLGHSFATSSAMGSGQARVVLFSGQDLALAGATSVFVNGIYHAVGLFLKLSHFSHLSRQSLSHVQHILLIF